MGEKDIAVTVRVAEAWIVDGETDQPETVMDHRVADIAVIPTEENPEERMAVKEHNIRIPTIPARIRRMSMFRRKPCAVFWIRCPKGMDFCGPNIRRQIGMFTSPSRKSGGFC